MIARRYAKALLRLALKEGSEHAVKNDIVKIGELSTKKRYFEFFTDRLIKASEKLGMLGGMQPLTKDFLKLVIMNRRERYLGLISREYVMLLNKKENVEDVGVSSKVPLSFEQKTMLKIKLEKRLGKKINISFGLDRKMIGGICVRYSDRVIDGTVSGQLKRILSSMTGR